MTTSSLPSLLQRFFTERLITQQGVSPHTVAGYRDTFRLLFRFTTQQLHRAPSALRLEDLDAPFLERFLEHLERDRHNHPRTRNHRLAALHGFFPVCRARRAGLEPALSADSRDSLEAVRTRARGIRHRGRDRRTGRRAERGHVGRTTRSHAAAHGRTDGVAEQRNHDCAATGCRAGYRRTCALRRERTQVSVHAVASGCDRGVEGVAVTTRWSIR